MAKQLLWFYPIFLCVAASKLCIAYQGTTINYNRVDQESKCNEIVLCTSSMDKNSGTVCGSDGTTYKNLCELKKHACAHGNQVSEQHRGPCSKELKCIYTRSHQLLMQRWTNNTDLFVPECETNGSFSLIQCHNSTGYCWCSKEDGTPVPGSALMNKKPQCISSSRTGRRSSRRQLGKPRTGCGTLDRSYFNSNIIKYFKHEYEDIAKKNHKQPSTVRTSQVIEWKFNQLDIDKNNKITKREIKSLRKLVRDIIRPMICAKKLWAHCDTDHNKRITKSEWFLCLGVDMNVSVRLLHSLNPGSKRPSFVGNDNKPISSENKANLAGLDLLAFSESIVASKNDNTSKTFLLKEGRNNDKEATDDLEKSYPDCATQRTKATRDYQENPIDSIYIPSCLKQNTTLFERVQCHTSTQFCWCVESSTGKPIPGTSVQYSRPICDRIVKDLGEIKECPGHKKRQFFQRLVASMTTNMNARGGIGKVNNSGRSRTEIIVFWQFDYLDKNRNKIIDKLEWREYRNTLKSWHGVRKCGRNFLRYCDQNRDRKITLVEWKDCMLRNIHSFRRHSSIVRKNPFTNILKADP